MNFRSLIIFGLWIVGSVNAGATDDQDAVSKNLAASGSSSAQRDFFEARIRPVLIEHCYECHNSSDLAEGDLSVDHRDAMVKGGSLGSLFNVDEPAAGLLQKVIRHEIDGLEMPESGPKLSPQVIEDFETWVRNGAIDPRTDPPSESEIDASVSWDAISQRRQNWWSFQPIIRPPVPGPSLHGKGTDGVAGSAAIDRFVNAKLLASKLTVAGQADRLTLLRRLTFALTGLPPTRNQMQRFSSDTSSNAYELLVDDLLDHSAFGERWARHWMDWIRYAESHGSEGDPAIADAWRYRDYLIRAINDDVGYDQLLREHVAGDLIPDPRINSDLGINESVIGPAHWRMVFHGFAPTDALDEKVRFTDDAIDVFSKAFQSLTISCARCHNHKFDPISQADYYALFGVLASTRPGRAVIDDQNVHQHGRDRMQQIKGDVRQVLADAWRASVLGQSEEWSMGNGIPESADNVRHPLNPLYQVIGDGKVDLSPVEIERHLKKLSVEINTAVGKIIEHRRDDYHRRWTFGNPATKSYRYGNGLADRPASPGDFTISKAGDQLIEKIFPVGIHTNSLSNKDGGRLTVDEFEIDAASTLWIRAAGNGNATTRIVIQNYPRNGTVFPVQTLKSEDGGVATWHKFDLTYWQGDRMHFELATARDAPLLVKQDAKSWFSVREAVITVDGDQPPPKLDREYLMALFGDNLSEVGTRQSVKHSLTDPAELLQRYTETILAAIDHWRENTATEDEAILLDALIRHGVLPNNIADVSGAAALVDAYRDLESALPIPTRVPSLDEWKGQNHPLFIRGDHHSPAEVVPRRYLEAFDSSPFESEQSGRLELAQALLSPENPLTRRVIVNRVWHHLFGQGIVDTPDNFGRMGTQPSHPGLLDFLATEFSELQNWSLKKLIRSIVTSEAWKRSSRIPSGTSEVDPDNRLLSHFGLRRLDAEAIRDSLLAVSGHLTPKMYGGPVAGTSARRSVYVSVIRNRPDPLLTVFDAPVPFSAKGRRDVTNVPAQSLLLMNDPFVQRLASKLAIQISQRDAPRTKSGEPQQILDIDDETIADIWQRLFGRNPQAIEVHQTAEFFARLTEHHQDAVARRARLLTTQKRRVSDRENLIQTARSRIDLESDRELTDSPQINAVSVWDFEKDLRDSIGRRHGRIVGSAKIDAGSVVLAGDGYIATEMIEKSIVAKSFEAMVSLETLDQRGGGVMGIQTVNGATFDTIVYGEKEPRRWLSGSDHHLRTKSFRNAPPESIVADPVHLIMTYGTDGRVTCYRNGEVYGEPFKTEPKTFRAGDSQIIFGMRHGTNVAAGRMLRGRLHSARLYDRTLSAAEARLLSSRATGGISLAQIVESMEADERNRFAVLTNEIDNTNSMIKTLGPEPSRLRPLEDLIHSMLNMKEFIYVR